MRYMYGCENLNQYCKTIVFQNNLTCIGPTGLKSMVCCYGSAWAHKEDCWVFHLVTLEVLPLHHTQAPNADWMAMIALPQVYRALLLWRRASLDCWFDRLCSHSAPHTCNSGPSYWTQVQQKDGRRGVVHLRQCAAIHSWEKRKVVPLIQNPASQAHDHCRWYNLVHSH